MALWATTWSKCHYTLSKSVRHCKSLFLIKIFFKIIFQFFSNLNYFFLRLLKSRECSFKRKKKKANKQTIPQKHIVGFEMENTDGKIWSVGTKGKIRRVGMCNCISLMFYSSASFKNYIHSYIKPWLFPNLLCTEFENI